MDWIRFMAQENEWKFFFLMKNCALARSGCTLRSYFLSLQISMSILLTRYHFFSSFSIVNRSSWKFMCEYLSIFFFQQTSCDPLYLSFQTFAVLDNWCRLSYVQIFWFIVSEIISMLHKMGIISRHFQHYSHGNLSFWLIFEQ